MKSFAGHVKADGFLDECAEDFLTAPSKILTDLNNKKVVQFW